MRAVGGVEQVLDAQPQLGPDKDAAVGPVDGAQVVHDQSQHIGHGGAGEAAVGDTFPAQVQLVPEAFAEGQPQLVGRAVGPESAPGVR